MSQNGIHQCHLELSVINEAFIFCPMSWDIPHENVQFHIDNFQIISEDRERKKIYNQNNIDIIIYDKLV